jgi:predicted nucleic acid-binding protein
MILVDTSIWVDHLRSGDRHLAGLLDAALVLGHPWVVGELALGGLGPRHPVLELLGGLPQSQLASEDEVLVLIGQHALHGMRVGYVDVQLLASTALTSDAKLWSKDRSLMAVAERLGCAHSPADN